MKMGRDTFGILFFVVLGAGIVTSRAATNNRNGVPDWTPDPEFAEDVFTFVRVEYDSYGRGPRGRDGSGSGCYTDYPDSDLNFSYRLHQLTSMDVDPEGKVLRLTDPRLNNYPFLYMCEAGTLTLRPPEVKALRQYLLNGGFLMVDDFWGEGEWRHFYSAIKQVFPQREPIELDMSHPIFHAVFDLKEKPQVPGISFALEGRNAGVTWERSDAREVHYWALYDDEDRMMAIICHNTDLGDGWEREGENEWFFREFSETKAYPMGINIVFYAMTH